MASTSGPSAPPIQATGPDAIPSIASDSYGISAPGSVVGPPPPIDPVVGARINGILKQIHGMGNH